MEYYAIRQVVLVLVGMIGSGKSTFANALRTHFPQFVRCNQDELGKRKDVEREVYQALEGGRSACIDRTNFDASQRQTWIKIAREYPGVKVWALFFDVPKTVCLERLRTRVGHPTIKTFETAQDVLRQFERQWEDPCSCEGFDLAMRLPIAKPNAASADPSLTSPYSKADLQAILTAFAQAAEPTDRSPITPLEPIVCTHASTSKPSQPSPQQASWRSSRGNGDLRGQSNEIGGRGFSNSAVGSRSGRGGSRQSDHGSRGSESGWKASPPGSSRGWRPHGSGRRGAGSFGGSSSRGGAA